MRNNQKPLLFVDIDGVLSLFGFQSDRRPRGTWLNVEGIVHLISASASEHLHRLAVPLTWCGAADGRRRPTSTSSVPCHAHCAAVPHVHRSRRRSGSAARHWKLAAIEAHAGDRPLAWIDDAHDDSCRAWATARPARTLLVTTDPAAGLTLAHVEALERWAAGLTPAADQPGR
jgi:hypothetical protein